jgi:hypothetical protein
MHYSAKTVLIHASVAALLALALACPQPAAAQTNQGEIRGTVTDASGAVVPGVTITVTSLETGFKRSVTSDDTGGYVVLHLEPGSYQVVGELSGFKTFVREKVVLESNKAVRIDIPLEIGASSEKVLVQAVTPVIESETAKISDLVDERSLRHVVMGGRGAYNWILETAGAHYGTYGYTLNGSRAGANGVSIDGANVGHPVTGTEIQPMRPDQEMVREIRVDSVNNSAEFAHAGTITQTTLSGSNELHGQISYNLINGALNAANLFSTTRPRGYPIHNMFLTGGGPVYIPGVYDGRNRTFFFVHADGQERNADVARVYSVPTLAMRRGDLSALTGTAVRDPLTGQAFTGGVIPTSRIAASAQRYLDRFFPLPTLTTTQPVANYQQNLLDGDVRSDRAWSVRVDQKVNDKNTMFARYWNSIFTFRNLDGALPPEILGTVYRVRHTHSAILSDTHVFAPTMVNEFRLGFIRHTQPVHSAVQGKGIADTLGLTGFPAPLDAEEYGIPSVTIPGLQTIAATSTSRDTQNSWNATDSISFVKGVHSLKFGIDFLHNADSQYPASPSAQFGAFTFNGFATGQPFGDFLLGLPQTASRSSNVGPYYGSDNEWALFFQDDWKVKPSFTFNWGVRYERHLPWTEQNDRIHSFDPVTGSLVVPETATLAKIHPLFPKNIPIITASAAGFPSDSLVDTDNNDIAPRVGFAWRTGAWDVVVRGGYGLYYNFESRKGFRSMTAGPFAATETFDNALTGGVPLWSWPQAFPSTAARALGTQDVSATAVNLFSSYTHQWNFTLEKQIGAQGVRLSYIGNSSMQLPYRRNLNQPRAGTVTFNQNLRPFPLLRNITYFDQGATQSYNAFQIEVRRSYSRGLSLTAHYTWAKNLTDSDDSNTQGTLIEDNFDRQRERGNVVYTPRQRFVGYALWDLPFGRGRQYLSTTHPIIDGVLGGWTLSPNVAINSGVWYTPIFTGRDPSNTNTTTGRPDRICDGNFDGRSLARWFDTSCVTLPAVGAGRFGNAGRAIIEAPGFGGMNLGVFKYFTIREELKLRLQGHFMNVFNHPRLGGTAGSPDMNITSASVARIVRTDGSHGVSDIWPNRQIEVGLRLSW